MKRAFAIVGPSSFWPRRFLLAWRPAIAPVAPPTRASFPAALIARGEMLASAASLRELPHGEGWPSLRGRLCHGDPVRHHLFDQYHARCRERDGDWSEEAFRRAMRGGRRAGRQSSVPRSSYDHFNKLTDQDISAL